ncbi:MAG: nickel pincer cofactor biosynthesis protein LarC [Chloroflexi bacterium]|nr:nickel pincer cofactor biosynthesis protein LarC [Chloroflexota bacterium]
MRVAYVDARFGAAGDMLLGAALDAGADLEAVREALRALPVEGWSLDAHAVSRAGFAATKADVAVDAPQPPRTASEIVAMIEAAALPPRVRDRAVATFELLGSAERAVHGTPEGEDAHLHEVGGVDAIVDVVGTFAALEALGVERVCASGLPAGGGTARAAHGRLPVPAPAVLEMAARSGATLLEAQPGEPPSELVTPTAMAILGATADFARPALRIERVGIGAGTRDPEGWPNVVRLWVGEAEASATGLRPIALLETNVDDMPGEHLPFLEARLREAGALDVWWAAVQMKKGRPGLQITAVALRDDADAVAASMLEHSPTLGVRATELLRYEAEREVFEFESSLGPAAVKVKRLPGEPPRAAPEYEHARALAERSGLPIAEVYALLAREALAQLA